MIVGFVPVCMPDRDLQEKRWCALDLEGIQWPVCHGVALWKSVRSTPEPSVLRIWPCKILRHCWNHDSLQHCFWKRWLGQVCFASLGNILELITFCIFKFCSHREGLVCKGKCDQQQAKKSIVCLDRVEFIKYSMWRKAWSLHEAMAATHVCYIFYLCSHKIPLVGKHMHTRILDFELPR